MFCFFFFNDPAPTEISTLPLHDALPISDDVQLLDRAAAVDPLVHVRRHDAGPQEVRHYLVCPRGDVDRKSTRLNSSHANISYAVFCLKKKKTRFYRHLTQSNRDFSVFPL